jgi:hypothetical protein
MVFAAALSWRRLRRHLYQRGLRVRCATLVRLGARLQRCRGLVGAARVVLRHDRQSNRIVPRLR